MRFKIDEEKNVRIDLWVNKEYYQEQYGFDISDEKWNEIVTEMERKQNSILDFLDDIMYENYIEQDVK